MASVANIYPTAEETFPSSLYGKPDKRSYRAAMKTVVLDLMARTGKNEEELAETLGVGEDTIKNAAKELHATEAVTLLKIAFLYGEEAIDPVRQLYLCAPPQSETNQEKLKRLVRQLSAAIED